MYIKEYLIAKFADQSPGDYWYYDGVKANQTIADITTAGFFDGANLRTGDLLKSDMTDGSLLVNVDIVNNSIVIQQITAEKEILEFNTLNDFPAVGKDGVIYIALDTGVQYVWNGNTSDYTELSAASTWGSIGGTISSQTDLQDALSSKQNQLTIDPNIRTSSFGVSVYNKIYLVDSSSLVVVVSLVGSPVEGDQVGFISQNDTSNIFIQIDGQIPNVEIASIQTNVKQYLVLTYHQSKWIITTQCTVDKDGNLYTAALNNNANPLDTQVTPWSYIKEQIRQSGLSAFRLVSTDDTILITDDIVNVDASAGNITLTLPNINSTTYEYGQKTWQIRRLDNGTNDLTIRTDPSGSDIFLNGTTATTFEIEDTLGISIYVSLVFDTDGVAINNTFYVD
jgi:hypothetical protein